MAENHDETPQQLPETDGSLGAMKELPHLPPSVPLLTQFPLSRTHFLLFCLASCYSSRYNSGMCSFRYLLNLSQTEVGSLQHTPGVTQRQASSSLKMSSV